MTCIRKPMTETQARVAAQQAGHRQGVQFYPVYCSICLAYHITKGA